MSYKKMTKEELELLSNKDITNMILEETNKPIATADLFKKIIKLLELPENTFEAKIGEYYTALSTDKRFILLDNGKWDLRRNHTSDKIIKVTDEDDEEEEIDVKEEEEEETEEDSFEDKEEPEYDDANDELKDLVVIDEDELELEQ